MTPLQSRLVDFLKDEPHTVAEICSSLKISNGSTRSLVIRMYKKGLITRVGKGKYQKS
mgnify:FL=1|tara:strand:+ start:2573 stop:2746 length:174 start_codon:yes stop_codon:yes gene_type:complete